MTEQDIRWQQRFDNYRRARALLSSFLQKTELNDLEEQGLIQAFEYTHELAWNTLRDLLLYQGSATSVLGSRDATREAFRLGLLADGEVWMEMIKNRNLTSHTYNEAVVKQIVSAIRERYHAAFLALETTLLARVE
jgi:nucleotidyltransferase substrate binding protein (TIGR01987 family)